MKTTFILTLSLISFNLFGGEADQREKSLPSYYIVSDVSQKSLAKTEALVVFGFYDENGKVITSDIKFSYNGVNKTDRAGAANKVSIGVKPGKYVFRFWYDESHYEITTDSLIVETQHRVELRVNFSNSKVMMICDKPVIYLYPEKTMPVSIFLKPKGEFGFTYPEYKNGWKIKANPDGSFESGGKKYHYIFWDGKVEMNIQQMDLNYGFKVKSDSLVSFFEQKLSQMGLNSQEREDYITYWVPRMNANELNYVHFIFNEEYDDYAELKVTPKPDKIFRVFMIWSKTFDEINMELTPQEIPSFHREGFTVVEWGGSEMKDLTPNRSTR